MMLLFKSFVFVCFVSMLPFLHAEWGAYPRVVAEKVYLDSLKSSQNYDWKELFTLSLEASGVAVADFSRHLMKVEGYIRDLEGLLEPLSSDYAQGEAILLFMHSFLGNYEALQTRMDTMFQTGSYNCVSSAILFATLARAFGFEVTGIGTYDHAFVNFALSDGRYIDVETTTKFGFDPGKKKEFVDSFTSSTGLVYVPKNNYRKRDDLTDSEFISLILQNRLYILNQQDKSFRVLEKMIPLAADLATLTQSEKDIQNFFSMVSQYSFNLAENGEVKRALDFAELVLDTYGRRESILDVRDRVAYNDVVRFIQKKQYETADAKLKLYRKQNVIKQKNDRKLVITLRKLELEKIINSVSASFEQKLSAIKIVEKENIFSVKQLEDLYQVVYGNQLNGLMRKQIFAQALSTLESYPEKLKKSTFYKKMTRVIETNFVASVYNQVVTQVGRSAYGEAAETLSQGLNVYPKNSKLKELKAKLQRVQQTVS